MLQRVSTSFRSPSLIVVFRMLIDIDMPRHSITERNRFPSRRRKVKRDQPSAAVAILSLLFAAVKCLAVARGRRVRVNGDGKTGGNFFHVRETDSPRGVRRLPSENRRSLTIATLLCNASMLVRSSTVYRARSRRKRSGASLESSRRSPPG